MVNEGFLRFLSGDFSKIKGNFFVHGDFLRPKLRRLFLDISGSFVIKVRLLEISVDFFTILMTFKTTTVFKVSVVLFSFLRSILLNREKR